MRQTGTMIEDLTDPKATLQLYLQRVRQALLWKLEGLSERDLRLPRTSSGLNLAGIVKHCANVEIGYFGPTFDRPWPTPEDACYVALEEYDDDPQADWYLPTTVTTTDLVDFYRRVWEFADRTIEELPLDAVGSPPWWGGKQVTLLHMLIRVTEDLGRHAGQADILREGIDGAIGLNQQTPSIPGDDEIDWSQYLAKLTAIAESFD